MGGVFTVPSCADKVLSLPTICRGTSVKLIRLPQQTKGLLKAWGKGGKREKTKKEMIQMERGGGPYRKWPLSQKKNQCLTSLVVTFIAKCHSIWDLFSKANNCHCFIFSFLFNHLILPFSLTVSKKQYPASVESFVRMRFFHENENKYKNSLIRFKS